VPTRDVTKTRARYRVIYGDTDQMGVAYYANYLRWLEIGRTELLRQTGFPYTGIESRGLHFPVTEVTCSYFKPARYDDQLVIETSLADLGRASLVFRYEIYRQDNPEPIASGSTKHACVDGQGRVTRIPRDLLVALSAVCPS
jgi:acyl-CoA thioester hydrolase